MNIQLTGQRERVILSFLRSGEFASADDVIDEALRLLGNARGGPNVLNGPVVRDADQRDNLRRLGERLDAMPPAAILDRLTNRDHDRILYGE